MGNTRSTMLPPDLESLLDLKDIGIELRIHPQSVRRLIKEKKLPGIIFFAGKYLIHRDTLAEFKERGYDPKPGRKSKRGLL